MALSSERRRLTPGQRWKRRRDLTIAAASTSGASCRFLSDVFDLSPSHISRILSRIRLEFGRKGGICAESLAREIRTMRRAKR